MDIPRYRIGNDLTVLWAICNNDGTPFDLSGKGVRLFVTNERGMTEVVPTITTDKNGSITNVILWTFLGNNQKVLGKHTLTVEIVTADDKRVIKRDISDAFNLVARSEGEESGGEANAVDSGTIYLSTKLDVYRFGNARVEIGTNGNWFIDGYDTGRTALAGEPGIVHNIYTESDLGKEFDPDSKIDTFNAHAINAINNALKRMTLEQLQDLSLADLEEYDVLAYNGNAWLNVPFRDLLNIFKGPSESSSGIGDGFWYLNEQDGKIHTDIGIVVHGDAIVEGDTSSGGEGEDVVVGIQGVRVNGTTHFDEDGDGVVDLGTIKSGIESVSWTDIIGRPTNLSEFNNNVPYITDEELKPLGDEIETISALLSSMWHLDENGNLVTDKQVLIKNNLIIDGDTSSGGEGEDTPGGGISGVKVNGVTYYDDNGDGVIDLGTISGGGGTADLSNYYTKAESDARYLAVSGGTISGTVTFSSANPALILHRASSTPYMRFGASASSEYGEIGVNSNGDAVFWSLISSNSAYNAWHTLIHSGNIGSYKAGGLATPRTIWGQSFDGTGDVSGMPRFSPNTYSSSITTSSSSIVLSSKAASMNGYNTGIALAAIGGYDSNYQNHLHAWIGLGARTSTSGAELYPLVFATNNSTTTNTAPTERMRIMPNGNVLIGTTTDNGAKLYVDGDAKFGKTIDIIGNNASSARLVIKEVGANVNYIHLYVDSNNSTTNRPLVLQNGYGNVGIGTASPSTKLDVNGTIATNQYIRINAWTGYGSGSCDMWYSGTANTLEISSSVKTMHSLTVTDNLTVNGFAESTYNRNTGMSSTMYFTSTAWLRIWKGTYGSAVRLQIGKNYFHMDPMVLCVDVSIGYSSAAISVTCNADAFNLAIQAIRVTQDASGNYNIDVLVYNAVVNTDVFRVCGNSGLGHIVAFETADNSATVLEQISVVPNASIISNNLIVAGDVASA